MPVFSEMNIIKVIFSESIGNIILLKVQMMWSKLFLNNYKILKLLSLIYILNSINSIIPINYVTVSHISYIDTSEESQIIYNLISN